MGEKQALIIVAPKDGEYRQANRGKEALTANLKRMGFSVDGWWDNDGIYLRIPERLRDKIEELIAAIKQVKGDKYEVTPQEIQDDTRQAVEKTHGSGTKDDRKLVLKGKMKVFQ